MKKVLLLLILFSCEKNKINTSSIVPDPTPVPVSLPCITGNLQHIVANDRYNSFGNLFLIDNKTIGLSYRSGSTHLNNGKVQWMRGDGTNWEAPITINTPISGYDFRDPKASVLNGEKIMVFTSKYIPTSDQFESLGYFLSTDITGQAWSNYQPLTPPFGVNRFITYGAAIKSDEVGTYYACAYGFTGSSLFKVWLWKIEYTQGQISNVSIIDVYSGTKQITESAIVRLGAGKFVIVSRVNDRNQVIQFNSSDGGNSWSQPFTTDMGDITKYGACVPSNPILVNGNLICLYQDRQTNSLMIAKNDVDSVFISQKWNPQLYNKTSSYLGYPSALIFSSGVLFSWAEEITSTQAEINSKRECIK